MRNLNIHGFDFTVNDEPADYWGWIENGHYQTDFDAIKHFADPNTTFIDLGAWVGADTLYASCFYKHVHAVESDPEAIKMLRTNVCLKNATIHPHAIMGHTGTTTMGGQLLGCSCTRQTCADNQVTVPCMTLREFCKDIPDPLVIKMDVEGAEAQILQDWQFFQERKPVLLLSTHKIWWEEGGSDCTKEFAAITKVGNLYKHTLSEQLKPIDLRNPYGDVIFTDKL